ncbi:IS91 family transposase, partial [Vibrio mediterranei]
MATDSSLREIEIEEVTKMLACGQPVMGEKRYKCENEACFHEKTICLSCSSRACARCGKKSTDNWIMQQIERLPDCEWSHKTFTMPCEFWGLFHANRWLLDKLCTLAVDNLLYAAEKRGLDIGIFCAIHTFGRQLTWHPHIHASVTLGGVNQYGDWKPLRFDHKKVEKRWRNQVCNYLLSVYDELKIPDAEVNCRNFDEFRRLVESQRNRFWHVHFAKKTSSPKKTLNYLGRYLKRPPISGARLSHYRGDSTISFRYLDHHTGKYETETVGQLELIRRLIQHIPEKGFRMIRYFGFLANRVVGSRLSKVRESLGMRKEVKQVAPLRYGQMMKNFLKVDPFECVICKSRMRLITFKVEIG